MSSKGLQEAAVQQIVYLGETFIHCVLSPVCQSLTCQSANSLHSVSCIVGLMTQGRGDIQVEAEGQGEGCGEAGMRCAERHERLGSLTSV